MALFNSRSLSFKTGEKLRLIDYQFPLKSVQSDQAIGKIDLLGLSEEGTLTVVEMKVDANREDRRIGILESLIYAAIVEANLPKIAAEVTETYGYRVSASRPKIVLLAPEGFWSNETAYPPTAVVRELAMEIGATVPIDIVLLCLHNHEKIDLGLDGSKPTLQADVLLSPVH
jgi:hypothetical protein